MRGRLVSLASVVVLGALAAGCGGSSSRTVSGASTAAGVGSASGAGVVGSAAHGASPAAGLPSGSLSLLTYNVAGLPQFVSQVTPATNTPRISPLLNRYELVLVQEDFWYHTDLQRDAQHPFQSLPLAQYTTFVNDGLNRFSQTPFVDHTRDKWDHLHGYVNAGSDGLSSKGFSVARHELGPGVVVDVYNLHADAGGSADDQRARLLQFAELERFMSVYSPTQAVVVAGDTNLHRGRAAENQLLDDFTGATGLREVGLVLPAIPDHIDRVFYRSNLDVELTPTLWRVADEFVDASGQDLSDHPAIHVDFTWRRLR